MHATSTPLLLRTSAVYPTYSSNNDHLAHTSYQLNTIGSRLDVAAAVGMCQYRYYYYAGCRHQRTVLVKYCADATSELIVPALREPPANSEDDEVASAHDEMASATSPPVLSTPDSATLPSPSDSSPDIASASHISHQQYTLASISELTSDVTSLQTQHINRRNTVTVVDDMATGALPAFARTNNWRKAHQLMTGASNADPDWVMVDNKENIVSPLPERLTLTAADHERRLTRQTHKHRNRHIKLVSSMTRATTLSTGKSRIATCFAQFTS